VSLDLTVDADIPDGVDLLGKDLDELQSNVKVGRRSVSGTLHYVTGYTGFSSKTEEQSGHYVAIHADSDDATTITAKMYPSGMEVELDSDRTIIIRVTNINNQRVTFTASKEGSAPVSKTFSFTGLNLEKQS